MGDATTSAGPRYLTNPLAFLFPNQLFSAIVDGLAQLQGFIAVRWHAQERGYGKMTEAKIQEQLSDLGINRISIEPLGIDKEDGG